MTVSQVDGWERQHQEMSESLRLPYATLCSWMPR